MINFGFNYPPLPERLLLPEELLPLDDELPELRTAEDLPEPEEPLLTVPERPDDRVEEPLRTVPELPELLVLLPRLTVPELPDDRVEEPLRTVPELPELLVLLPLLTVP
ncbi:MAG: hypothetical protein MI700_03300, partial [Balneolales bacterium]|nr:hypothetical protein [Balneolales bacterium]